MGPDPSVGLDSGGVIDQVFPGIFIFNSSFHDFETVEEGRKMSIQLWLRMSGYLNYIRIYLFFCFTDKVRGKKTEKSDVATYFGISKLSIIQIRFYLFFCFTEKVRGTKTEKSNVATYGGRIHVYIIVRVRFEQSTVATYGGISKLYIIQIRFYRFFCFNEEVRGIKSEQSDVAKFGGRIHAYISLQVRLFG